MMMMQTADFISTTTTQNARTRTQKVFALSLSLFRCSINVTRYREREKRERERDLTLSIVVMVASFFFLKCVYFNTLEKITRRRRQRPTDRPQSLYPKPFTIIIKKIERERERAARHVSSGDEIFF